MTRTLTLTKIMANGQPVQLTGRQIQALAVAAARNPSCPIGFNHKVRVRVRVRVRARVRVRVRARARARARASVRV